MKVKWGETLPAAPLEAVAWKNLIIAPDRCIYRRAFHDSKSGEGLSFTLLTEVLLVVTVWYSEVFSRSKAGG